MTMSMDGLPCDGGNHGGWETLVSQEARVRRIRAAVAAYAAHADELTDARVVAQEKVGDHDTYLVLARPDEKTRERLYFDTASGLLVRRTTIKDTPIGPIPQQTDFEDYRDVGGTKYPFTVKISLVDPWSSSTRHYTDVQLGAKLDDAVFTPPAGNQPSS